MPYLIGTDEAGYGPNLGPLVIAATVWRVPCDPQYCDLYELLEPIVGRSTSRAAPNSWTIADSKLLYKPGLPMTALERNLLAAIAHCQTPAANCRDLWNSLDPQACLQFEDLPWHATHNAALPLDADPQEIASLAEQNHRRLGVSKRRTG